MTNKVTAPVRILIVLLRRPSAEASAVLYHYDEYMKNHRYTFIVKLKTHEQFIDRAETRVFKTRVFKTRVFKTRVFKTRVFKTRVLFCCSMYVSINRP